MSMVLIEKEPIMKFIEDGLNNKHYGHVGVEIITEVEFAPTIDAVPVVRCEECVCCSRWNDQLVCSRISGVMDGYYHGTVDVVKPDDYCSHGIRKTAKPIDSNKNLE